MRLFMVVKAAPANLTVCLLITAQIAKEEKKEEKIK